MTPYVPENLIPEESTLTSVMDTWVDQAGYPVVTFTRDYDNQGAKVTQVQLL
jgi:aminopeptidase N